MSRTAIDYNIATRTARADLAAGKVTINGKKVEPRQAGNKPFFHTVVGPIAVGWQSPTVVETAGRFVARKTIGLRQYVTQAIGTADDIAAADGKKVFSYDQAAQKALEIFHAKLAAAPGDVTIRDALAAYLADPTDGYKGDYAVKMLRDANREIFASIILDKGYARIRELKRAQLGVWRDGLLADLIARKRARLKKSGEVETEKEIVRKAKDSANKTLSLFMSTCNHAFRQPANGLLSDTEWRVALSKYGKVSRARTHCFTAQEMQHWIDSCKNRQLAKLIGGAYLTGGRYGELRAAIVADFSQRGTTLRLDGKTGARFVPLSDDTVEFFAELCRGKKPHEPIFTNMSGRAWGKNTHSRPVKESLQDAGMDTSATFYATRHSHITAALEDNVQPQEIADNCGTSVRMIHENYAHVTIHKKRESLNRMNLRVRLAPQLRAVA